MQTRSLAIQVHPGIITSCRGQTRFHLHIGRQAIRFSDQMNKQDRSEDISWFPLFSYGRSPQDIDKRQLIQPEHVLRLIDLLQKQRLQRDLSMCLFDPY